MIFLVGESVEVEELANDNAVMIRDLAAYMGISGLMMQPNQSLITGFCGEDRTATST